MCSHSTQLDKERIATLTPVIQAGVRIVRRHHLLVRCSHWLKVSMLLGLILGPMKAQNRGEHPGRLPAAGVSTAVYVEYLSAHLRCPRKVENSVHNLCYVRHFSHWLQRLKKVLGIIGVRWGVHDAGGYSV